MSLPTSTAEKIATAKQLKERGNQLFKQGDFKSAKFAYAKVFAYIGGLRNKNDPMSQYSEALGYPEVSDDELRAVHQLTIDVNANLAAVYLRLGDPENALKSCFKVLNLDDEHVKASLRAGQAYMKLGNLDKAKGCLTTAAKLEPNNVAIRAELRNLAKLFAEREQREKRAFARAFGGGQEEKEDAAKKEGTVEAEAVKSEKSTVR